MSSSVIERSEMLQERVRIYFEACNESDREKMFSVCAPSVVHYFPPGMFGPQHGVEAISTLWESMVERFGSRWTIDNIVGDSEQAVVEWTHFQPKAGSYIRGAEWYEFDEDGLITVIKAYYASPRDTDLEANELAGYSYEDLGYPMKPPGD